MIFNLKNKDNFTHFLYNFFASIVILGALCKITHFNLGPISSNLMLTIGLLGEAIIFLYSAFFDLPINSKNINTEHKYLNSFQEHINIPIKDYDKLEKSFKALEDNINNLNGVLNSINYSNNYNLHLKEACDNFSKFNSMYSEYLNDTSIHIEKTKKIIDNISYSFDKHNKIKENLESLSCNIESMNNIYSNMLDTMKK